MFSIVPVRVRHVEYGYYFGISGVFFFPPLMQVQSLKAFQLFTSSLPYECLRLSAPELKKLL